MNCLTKRSNTSSNPKPFTRLQGTKNLDAGVHLLAKTVGVTMGPFGRTVGLDRPAGFLWTRDGAIVAWEVDPENKAMRMGVKIVQDACARVSKLVGDGTSTTAILIGALLRQVRKEVAVGADPWRVSERLKSTNWRALLEGWDADERLLEAVALAASHGDQEISRALIQAMALTGSQGLVVVEEGTGRGVEVLSKPGFILDQGWESSDLAGLDGGPRILEAPLVALLDTELTRLSQVESLLEEATAFPHPLLIICRGIFGEALQTLVANDRKLERTVGPKLELGTARVPVRNRIGWFSDLEALTGATLVPPGTKRFDPAWFGALRKVESSAHKTILVAHEDANERLEVYLEGLQNRPSESTWEAEEQFRRAAMLSGGLCVLRVGGHSPVEIKERKGRVEDALRAVQCAAKSGVVSQGVWLDLCDLEPAFSAPAKQVWRNAGLEPLVILGSKPPGSWVFDVRTQSWVSPLEYGLVLPLEMVATILEVISSVVAELCLTDLVLTKFAKSPI